MSEHLILNDFSRAGIDAVLQQLDGVHVEGLKEYKEWEIFPFTDFQLQFDPNYKTLKVDFIRKPIYSSETLTLVMCPAKVFVKKVKKSIKFA